MSRIRSNSQTRPAREYLDIIDFTSRPDIAAWISHIDTLHVRNLRDSALAELETCLRSSRDPVERRRAATTILRATDPRPIRSRKPARTHEPAAPAKTITNHTSDTHEPAASFEPPAPAEEVTNLASTTGQDAAPAMNASSPTSTSNELASPAEAVTDPATTTNKPAATNIEPAPPQHPCDLARNAPTKPLNGLARPPSFPP